MSPKPKRRSDAVRSISKDGWKKREAVEVVLSSLVLDLRDLMRQKIPAGDAALVSQFFEETKKVFQSSMSVDPPMDPKILIERINGLRGLATGPLVRFGERLEKALERLTKADEPKPEA